MTAAARRPRVNWITHLPAPYRIPVWRALSADWDLEVQCVEADLGGPGAENRGADWAAPVGERFAIRTLRTARLRWRSLLLYIRMPSRGARSMRHADVLLLGGWESPAYWQAYLAARLWCRPVVSFYESTPESSRFSTGPVAQIRSWLFRGYDAVVVPGAAARRAVEAMGVPADRILQGFNAVDVRVIAEQAAAIRAAAGPTPPAVHRFVSIGQLIHRKRVVQLLEGFLATGGADDTMTFVGTGPLADELTAAARRAGASDRVLLVGHVDYEQLPRVLAAADTLCLVSEEEVWGLVVNEGLAAGLQVVVSAQCGVTPSVSGMRGVHVVAADLQDLPRVLAEARSVWTGPIVDPEILRHDPEAFAATFARAFDRVLSAGRRSPRGLVRPGAVLGSLHVVQVGGLAGPDSQAGGVWSVASGQSALLRQRHRVELFGGWLGPPPEGSRGTRFVRLRRPFPGARLRAPFSLAWPLRLANVLRGADLMHVHLARDYFSTSAVLVARLMGVPVVAQTHGMIAPADRPLLRAFDSVVRRLYLSSVQRWLTLTDAEERQLESFGVPPRTLRRVFNATGRERSSWRAPDEPRFGFISRLDRRKQPTVFVDAAAQVSRSTTARFLIAGPDQGELDAVRARVAEHGIASVVDLRAALQPDEVQAELQHLSALVLPSVGEVFPMIVVEALAVGTPVILTADSGISEALAEHSAALIVPPRPDAVARAMRRIAVEDGLAARLSAAGHAFYRQRWSTANLLDALTDVYGEVTSGAAPSRTEPT